MALGDEKFWENLKVIGIYYCFALVAMYFFRKFLLSLPDEDEARVKDGKTIGEKMLKNGAKLVLVHGSILDYVGNAFVNAANEGCVGGFGVDEQVNKSGGIELKKARKKLKGCKTGEAKVTSSFEHKNTKWIIHAVGPAFRINPIKDGIKEATPEAVDTLKKKDVLLRSAYKASLKCAEEKKVETIGFCMLSAGVFRGQKSLQSIVDIACDTISENAYDALKSIHLVAYTDEEAESLQTWLDRKCESKKVA